MPCFCARIDNFQSQLHALLLFYISCVCHDDALREEFITAKYADLVDLKSCPNLSKGLALVPDNKFVFSLDKNS